MIINLIQFLTNAASMSSNIFIPILCKELGGNNFTVGLVVGIYNLAILFSSYVFGTFSDRGGIKNFVRIGLALSSAALLLQIFIQDLTSLVILRGFLGLTMGIYPAALATYAFSHRGGKMGKFVGYGSLGWALGSILAGLMGSYNFIFIFGSVACLLAFSISLKFKDLQHQVKTRLFSIEIFKKNSKIYSKYLLRSLGANTIWTIFPLYMLSLGADKFWIGVTYFINTFSQFFITRYIERFRNTLLIQVGVFFSIITFLGYALSPNWIYILPLQVLLAFSFGTLQVGVIQEVMATNREKSTVAGTLTSIINLSAVLGPIICGVLAGLWGYQSVMYFAAILSAVALFF